MANDAPVCAICLESDEKEKLIFLHEKFDHCLHAGCYSKKTIGLTCPLCTKPFSSQQSREILDDELRTVFDKSFEFIKLFNEQNFKELIEVLRNGKTPKQTIIDAFALKHCAWANTISNNLELFFLCAVACENYGLIALSLKAFEKKPNNYGSPYYSGSSSSYYHNAAILTACRLNLVKVLEYLAALEVEPSRYEGSELITHCCQTNSIETLRTLYKVYPKFKNVYDPECIARATSTEMAELLLTECSEAVFSKEGRWRRLDFDCFVMKCTDQVKPFVKAWKKIRAAGFGGKSLPPPYGPKEYRDKLRFDDK